MQSQEAGASCLSNANALLKVLTIQENNYPWCPLPGHMTLTRVTCVLEWRNYTNTWREQTNKNTWNSGKRDPEAADIPDLGGGLHQGLDGGDGGGGLRQVLGARGRGLQLARAQGVEVAVGGHVGGGGGRGQGHDHHHQGPGHAPQPRGVGAHHPHHWDVTASLVRVTSISLSLTLQREGLMRLSSPQFLFFISFSGVVHCFLRSRSLSSNFLSVWI